MAMLYYKNKKEIDNVVSNKREQDVNKKRMTR